MLETIASAPTLPYFAPRIAVGVAVGFVAGLLILKLSTNHEAAYLGMALLLVSSLVGLLLMVLLAITG
jgi:hypothetical protein